MKKVAKNKVDDSAAAGKPKRNSGRGAPGSKINESIGRPGFPKKKAS